MADTRIEKDALGEVPVPAHRQTGWRRLPLERARRFIRLYAGRAHRSAWRSISLSSGHTAILASRSVAQSGPPSRVARL